MCGICGIVSADPQKPVDSVALRRMRDVMAHRGPDDAGLCVLGPAGLAMRRLSIIDLDTGQQPILSDDGAIALVFNGEIYNYIELREACVRDGQHFHTKSDTEVILRLYEKYGADCTTFLNGMFAFAIWDSARQQLLLGRDRLGIKPLYYTVQHDTLFFASEIKSLLQHPQVSFDIDQTAIAEFTTFGFVQTPRTIFSGILRVPEGHVLTWSSGTARVRQYWDLDFGRVVERSESSIVEETRALLQDAVSLTLRSDVPVGVLLSGGIDSSSITALVSKGSRTLKTFSVGFVHGREYNELQFARETAGRFGTEHYELLVDSATFRDAIPTFVYHMDEPVADSAGIPLYLISKVAAEHVKVLLSGEGADELFAGYPIYGYMRWIERYRHIPAVVRKAMLDPLIRTMLPSTKVEKYLYLSGRPLESRFTNTPLYDPRLPARLYTEAFRDELGSFDPIASIQQHFHKSRSWDLLSRMLYIDTKTWLPNSLLMKADRMTMAASVELRVPFLDHRLAEFAAAVPSRMKLRQGKTKHLLREAMKTVLPASILSRCKMGFPTPLSRMFRADLQSYCRDILLSQSARERGYLEPRVVERILREHAAGEADHAETIWRMLVLEQWHKCVGDTSLAAGQNAQSASTNAALPNRETA